MKPAAFSYLRPRTVPEALELLGSHRDRAKILAGGQSLVPILNFRLGRFDYLIDINRIAELSYIRLDGEFVRIGATTRYREIENSLLIQRHAPLLATATRSIAHLPVRTRGTIGGSLAHADPAAEYPAVLAVLEGAVVAQNRNGAREIAAQDLFRGLFTTALEQDELLTEVKLPVARPHQVFGFAEFARRPGDLALVGLAACLELERGVIQAARLAAFGVEDAPQRLTEIEEQLTGHSLTPSTIERAATAARTIAARDDIHASAGLRRHLAEVLTRRVLNQNVHQPDGPA
jgi:carbon-monoxide dehydrogenase medium subunit